MVDAVDLYVQALDYRRIPTSQIPTPVGAEIRQIMPESGDVRQPSLDSSGTVLDSGQLAGATGSPAIWPDLAVLAETRAWIRPFCAGFRQRLPESSTNGLIPPTYAGNCMKNIFLLIFFYFVNKI
jgi:hypothetical protein